MSDPSKATPEPEPFRVPDGDLDDLASTLAKTMAEVRQHGVILDRLGSEPVSTPQPTADTSAAGADKATVGATISGALSPRSIRPYLPAAWFAMPAVKYSVVVG